MIDWSRITELRTEIGIGEFAEVVTLFLDEADTVVRGLPECRDARSLKAALHFLKGAALNLGFADLARLCQDGERQAASGVATVDLAEVAATYEASKSAFHAGKSRSGSSRAA